MVNDCTALQASALLEQLDSFSGEGGFSDVARVNRVSVAMRRIFPSFTSTNIVTRSSEKGGMGMFATHNIPSGSLLLVDHPVASMLDIELSRSRFFGLDGGDTLALVEYVLRNYSEEIEACLRQLHPIRSGLTPDSSDLPHELVRLTSVLSPDISIHSLVKAVESNSLGYYTLPELASNEDSLRYLSGTGLYGASSMFNHSCSPNVTHYSFGDVMFFRTNRDIAEGDELCISYIGNDMVNEAKSIRSELLDNRDFICTCEKCETPELHDDPWLEELDLPTRAKLHMLDKSEKLVPYIDSLLRDHAYVTRDKVKLLFLRCRSVNRADDPKWEDLLSLIGDADFTRAVVQFHYGATFGFTDGLKSDIQRVGRLCLGSELGDFDNLFKLLMITDFR